MKREDNRKDKMKREEFIENFYKEVRIIENGGLENSKFSMEIFYFKFK